MCLEVYYSVQIHYKSGHHLNFITKMMFLTTQSPGEVTFHEIVPPIT